MVHAEVLWSSQTVARMLTLLVANDVVNLGSVPVCRRRVSIVHLILEGKGAEGVALVLLACYLCLKERRGRRRLGLGIGTLNGIAFVTMLVIDLVESLWSLI